MTKLLTDKKFDKPTGDFASLVKTGDKLLVDFGGDWVHGKFVKDDRVLTIDRQADSKSTFYAIDKDGKQFVICLCWHQDVFLWDLIAQSAKQYSKDAMVATTLKRISRRR